MGTEHLPTAPEALARSIDAWETGQADAAQYWLAVATELRKGSAPVAAPTPALVTVSTGKLECRDCGGELIRRADGLVHRSTYKFACEPAYSTAISR